MTPASALPKGALTVAVEGATFALPLAGVIDIAGETARLSKSLEKLEKDVGGLKGRLNNPKFAANAAPEVVEDAQVQLAEKQDEAARLKEAIARLAAMS